MKECNQTMTRIGKRLNWMIESSMCFKAASCWAYKMSHWQLLVHRLQTSKNDKFEKRGTAYKQIASIKIKEPDREQLEKSCITELVLEGESECGKKYILPPHRYHYK